MSYTPDNERYSKMKYNRCGKSGLMLPAISLGLWHNFGSVNVFDNMRAMLTTAFDNGITHFDAANNYGPVPGSAEENLGKILKTEFCGHRDELIISTKAGYRMWPGPYGEFGSRKAMLSSLDQSLKRLQLDYVDIFYSHRYDPNTPLEETMGALSSAVKQGKALYVGISSYRPEEAKKAIDILKANGTPCLIHQPRYNILDRWIENTGLIDLLEQEGIGSIAFSPLSGGVLTNRYVKEDTDTFWNKSNLSPERLEVISQLNKLAKERGQALSQMSLAWILRKSRVTSALIGASSPEHVLEGLSAINNLEFTDDELAEIDRISSQYK